MKPVVAIIGRPNVGKSALFNRLVQKRVAIVEDIPGVTRDRITSDTEWQGKWFTLVDTGGLVADARDPMGAQIRRQVELALAEADVTLLVVDARDGVAPADRDAAEVVRRSGRPAILVVNKGEGAGAGAAEADAYSLGLGEPVVVSAIHGTGTGDLLDRIATLLPQYEAPGEDDSRVKVAIVGRPNVGKSSLLNAILGEERVIVSSEPGTTRDAVDVARDIGDRKFLFIDTAGMRRRSKVGESLEKYSVSRALRAVDRADVAVLVIAADQGVTDQDKKIAGYVQDKGKALVLCFNKFDLVSIDEAGRRSRPGELEERREALVELARWHLGFVSHAPVVFTTATDGQGVTTLIDGTWEAAVQHARRVPTPELNRVIHEAFLLSPPPSEKGKELKVYYATQVAARPPVFVLFVNEPGIVKVPYVRYLEGRLRQSFGFEGTPLVIRFRRRE
ncbi:MAG: ribosome biogenesis GTPase Der [Firmicutes bacterium]|nr:ribosome biogenesis GTPase Der [Bacillota bacterium]